MRFCQEKVFVHEQLKVYGDMANEGAIGYKAALEFHTNDLIASLQCQLIRTVSGLLSCKCQLELRACSSCSCDDLLL